MQKNRNSNDPVVVGGLTPLTTIDYPDHLAAVVFLQGCPWRCGYCQNGGLMARETVPEIPWRQLMSFLGRRKGLLDAVVFSGGEPTLHRRLDQAIEEVRALGYRIGLHTAGIYPERLRRLLPLVDWVGMDIKAARPDYDAITGVRGSGERAWRSAELVLQSGVAHEFRTTVHPDMLDLPRLEAMTEALRGIGADILVLQECITRHCHDASRRQVKAERLEPRVLRQLAGGIQHFSLRHA